MKKGPIQESILFDLFKLDENDRKKIVICVISAGFAAALGAPFAGAIFSVEVLYAGSLFGNMLGLDRATFAAVGFVGLLAGAANTPIAASILAVEFFGSAIAPYAAIACIVSFLMTGHRSVFPTQVLFQKK